MTKSDFGQDGSVKELFAFMDARQSIYLKKRAGKPWPWTDGPILQNYFFCNVYREQDTVTKWIAENWRNRDAPPDIMIFNMVVARFFNWIPTLEFIGWTANWDKQRGRGVITANIEAQLLQRQINGETTFNSAYLIAGTDLKGKNKITGVCDRLDWAWEHRKMLAAAIDIGETLEQAWKTLQGVPGVAGFIAYEIVTDLRHTPLLDKAPDIMTWANPGPGAIRGLQRIYGRTHVANNGALPLMQQLLHDAPKYTKLKLEMRDIEHSLCEYDKKKRIEQAIHEGRPVLGMRKYKHERIL